MSRHTKLVFVMLLIFVISFTVVLGCSNSSSEQLSNSNTNASSSKGSSESEEGSKEESVKPEDMGVMISGSASQGGSNYLIMSGWTEIIKETTGYQLRNESTDGPVANMQLMNDNGQAQFGVLSGIVAREGFDGEGWAAGTKLNRVRAMFGLHSLYMDGLTLKDSGIKNIRDLDGKTISVGPAGGTPYVLVRRVLRMLDIQPEYVELGQGDSVDALKNKLLDAVVFAGAYPRPAYVEAEANTPVTFIKISQEDVDKIISEYPAFKKGVIPAGTYDYLEEDNVTLKDRYMYATTADMPEELVYEITLATIEHFEEFQKVHKAIEKVDLQSLGDVPIPLHPGAAKALNEAGIEISDSAQPID